MKFLACFSIIFVIAQSLLSAQTPAISLKIDVIAWGDEIRGLTFKKGNSSETITAYPFRYSQPVQYTGPAMMEIFQTSGAEKKESIVVSEADRAHELKPLLPTAEESGEKANAPKSALALELEKRRKENPNIVALVPLPSNCNRATVLLAPAENGTFIAYVIDDDPTKLPLGQLRIHNLSPYPIAMRCNGKAAKEMKMRESIVAVPEQQQIIYELAYQFDDEWKMQENNIMSIRPDEQAQMLVLKSENRYFLSTDGSASGFLQTVTLRRSAAMAAPAPTTTVPTTP